MLFSQRIGKQPVETEIQIESMDQDLRVGLWNILTLYYINPMVEGPLAPIISVEKSRFRLFLTSLWLNFFHLPLQSLPPFVDSACKRIEDWFNEAEWHQVYSFIEFVSQIKTEVDAKKFRESCNVILEREVSGYRFVEDKIVPITNATELNEIAEALSKTKTDRLAGVSEHLESALVKLSDRQAPDYRNSIKESISAVESLCQVIAGEKATLGQALKVVKNKVNLHPALEKGFSSLYGWTNDAGGIRHALTDDSLPCDGNDAKYMLVSCSAFVNYLLAKAANAGITLT